MVSGKAERKYPSRMFPPGKAPSQHRSMNHSCHLSNMTIIKESVGVDAWDAISNSSVGVICKLLEGDYTWAAKTVHYFLTNQLAVNRPYEIWSLINGQPIRFSLNEYEVITGLNCGYLDGGVVVNNEHHEFWKELSVATHWGPCYNELLKALGKCRNWSFEKRRMLGWLCIISVGILGISPSSRIPLEMAKKVFCVEAFENFPWGRVGFESLIGSIKVVAYEGKQSYTLLGCVHALLIWIFEFVPGIGERYGFRREGSDNLVPILRWAGSRKRLDDLKLIKEEVEKHGKVRVHHLIVKPYEYIYPKWSGDGEDADLDNLIKDILDDTLDSKWWDKKTISIPKNIKEGDKASKKSKADVVREKGSKEPKKRKAEVVASDDDFVDQIPKTCKSNNNQEKDNLNGKNTTTTKEVHTKVPSNNELVIVGLDATIKICFDKVNDVEKRHVALEKELREKIQSLEEEVKELKGKKRSHEKEAIVEEASVEEANVEEANAALNKDDEEDDCGNSNTSWTATTKVVAEGNERIRCAVTKKSIKKEMVDVVDEMVDVTRRRGYKTPSVSEETWSDPIQREKFKRLGVALDGMASFIGKEGVIEDKLKRKPHMAQSQLSPFVGNSTMKRVISGPASSPMAYDPFAPADKRLIDKLEAFLMINEVEPVNTYDSRTEFYRIIVAPRKEWRTDDYGWLGCAQISETMSMLHQRSLKTPSPFRSSRIQFLGHWFVNQWVADYKNFVKNEWTMTDAYKNMCNGLRPRDMPSGKKWFVDIDHLYACLHVNGDHWIALDINLQKSTIHVYDSILCVVPDDKDILEACRVFTRMIPAMLNEVVSPTLRKKSNKQFKVVRLKSVPQNRNPGDCGVFAIKYLECLALGCSFEGLDDRNIMTIRWRLAAELFDLEPSPQVAYTNPLPRGDFDDHVPLMTSSLPELLP